MYSDLPSLGVVVQLDIEFRCGHISLKGVDGGRRRDSVKEHMPCMNGALGLKQAQGASTDVGVVFWFLFIYCMCAYENIKNWTREVTH